MRILVHPFYSSRIVDSAPTYNMDADLIGKMLRKHDDLYFYVVYPMLGKLGEGRACTYKARRNRFAQMDRVTVVEVPMAQVQQREIMLFPERLWELFNDSDGLHSVDLVWTEHPQAAPLIAKALRVTNSLRGPEIPVIASSQLRQTQRFNHDAGEDDDLLFALACLTSYPTFYSPHQRDGFLDDLRAYLTPAMQKRFLERATVIPTSLDCDYVDSVREDELQSHGKYDKITLTWSHKLYNLSHKRKCFEWMDSVYRSGRDVGLQIVSGSDQAMVELKIPKEFRHFQIFGGSTRERFLRLSSRAHIFLSNNAWEDCSLTINEQMYCGLLPVVPDREWARYQAPDDWPFFYRNAKEAQSILRHFVDEYEQVAGEWIPKLREHVRRKFGAATVSETLYELFRRVLAEAKERRLAGMPQVDKSTYEFLPKSMVELLEREVLMALGDRFTESELWAQITKKSSGWQMVRDQGMQDKSKLDLIRAVKRRGYRDLLDGPEIVFQRET